MMGHMRTTYNFIFRPTETSQEVPALEPVTGTLSEARRIAMLYGIKVLLTTPAGAPRGSLNEQGEYQPS